MKKFLVVIFIFSTGIFFAARTGAQEQAPVDYNGEVIVDSDLDGLTDKGEQQIYQTDPGNPDTDGDGYLDGTEIINGTDPLDAGNPGNVAAQNVSAVLEGETPWIWYLARVAGILGFIFLWLTVFLGLSIRNPILKKMISPIYSFDFHCFMAALAVFWALVHGTSLLLDPKLGFSLKDAAVPFFSQTIFVNPNYLAFGIMAFYMMAIMTATSYLKKYINHKFWRVLHFLNPLAFIFVVFHGYTIGTDMKNFYAGSAFLFSSFLLVLIYLSSLIFAVIRRFQKVSSESNYSL